MFKVTELVNTGRADAIVKIDAVEAKYGAKYVGQLCGKSSDGGWVNNPMDVFWQPNPPNGYSNYMGLLIQRGSLFITSGASAVEPLISGIVADDGEIIYSRYRHDYRVSKDGSVWIDGGRDYTRAGSLHNQVMLKIIDGEWFRLEEGDMVDGKTYTKGDLV